MMGGEGGVSSLTIWLRFVPHYIYLLFCVSSPLTRPCGLSLLTLTSTQTSAVWVSPLCKSTQSHWHVPALCNTLTKSSDRISKYGFYVGWKHTHFATGHRLCTGSSTLFPQILVVWKDSFLWLRAFPVKRSEYSLDFESSKDCTAQRHFYSSILGSKS